MNTFGKSEVLQDKSQMFPLSGALYCKRLKKYVFPKKFNEQTNTYICRSKDSEELELPESDLSTFIFLKVKCSDDLNEELKDDHRDFTKFRVKITDKLDKVIKIITEGMSGSLLTGGKVLRDYE